MILVTKNGLTLSYIMVTKRCLHLFALLALSKDKEVSSNLGLTRYLYCLHNSQPYLFHLSVYESRKKSLLNTLSPDNNGKSWQSCYTTTYSLLEAIPCLTAPAVMELYSKLPHNVVSYNSYLTILRVLFPLTQI